MKERRVRMVSCPFHDDRTPSLAIDDAAELFFCFECRRSGVVKDLPAFTTPSADQAADKKG